MGIIKNRHFEMKRSGVRNLIILQLIPRNIVVEFLV